MKHFKLLLLSLTVFMLSCNAGIFAQVNTAWVKDLSLSGNDKAYKIKTDSEQNVYVGGMANNDLFLVKYSPEGDTLWTRIYDGPNHDTEVFKDMITDNAGNVYLACESRYTDNIVKAVYIKYTKDGEKKWAVPYNYGANPFTSPTCFMIDWNGRVFSAITTFQQSTNNRIIGVIKIDTLTGAFTAGQALNFEQEPVTVNAIHENFSNKISLCTSRFGNFSIIKFDTSLIYKGEKTYDFGGRENNLFAYSTVVGHTYFAGMSALPDGSSDFILIKTNAEGDTLWSRRTNIDSSANGYDSLTAMAFDAQGSVVLFGTYTLPGLTRGTAPSHGLAVLRYAYEGTQVAKFKIADTNYDYYGGGIVPASNGHLYYTGTAVNNITGSRDITAGKVNLFNGLVWSRVYGFSNVEEEATAITSDNSSNAYVTGFSNFNSANRLITMKFSDVLTGIGSNNSNAEGYSLSQNYPNPFNPSTKIKFDIPGNVGAIHESPVKLTVYNSLGEVVSVLLNKSLQPGAYELTFDGAGFASGIYFYKLEAPGFTQTKKMLMIK